MKLMLALYDKKQEQFLLPFFVPTLGVAYRSIQDEISRGGEGNMLAAHPGDFQIFEIGVFDEDTGHFATGSIPRMVCEVGQLLSSPGAEEVPPRPLERVRD